MLRPETSIDAVVLEDKLMQSSATRVANGGLRVRSCCICTGFKAAAIATTYAGTGRQAALAVLSIAKAYFACVACHSRGFRDPAGYASTSERYGRPKVLERLQKIGYGDLCTCAHYSHEAVLNDDTVCNTSGGLIIAPAYNPSYESVLPHLLL